MKKYSFSQYNIKEKKLMLYALVLIWTFDNKQYFIKTYRNLVANTDKYKLNQGFIIFLF